MSAIRIENILRQLTKHDYITITTRGNSAITAALSIAPRNKKVLIPEEGGWLSFKTTPKKLGLEAKEVKCTEARIDLKDLQAKLATHEYGTFIYQNPGGYFAEQPMQKIYDICNKNDCLVVMDVSGSIGTELCNGAYADILVGSFGKWKLADAETGGFISCKSFALWKSISSIINPQKLTNETALLKILQKLEELPERIGKLKLARDVVVKDLQEFNVVRPDDPGLVVIVRFSTNQEKESNKMTSHFEHSQRERIINYCQKNQLEWTECPRYIRMNERAISIEVKRL